MKEDKVVDEFDIALGVAFATAVGFIGAIYWFYPDAAANNPNVVGIASIVPMVIAFFLTYLFITPRKKLRSRDQRRV